MKKISSIVIILIIIACGAAIYISQKKADVKLEPSENLKVEQKEVGWKVFSDSRFGRIEYPAPYDSNYIDETGLTVTKEKDAESVCILDQTKLPKPYTDQPRTGVCIRTYDTTTGYDTKGTKKGELNGMEIWDTGWGGCMGAECRGIIIPSKGIEINASYVQSSDKDLVERIIATFVY